MNVQAGQSIELLGLSDENFGVYCIYYGLCIVYWDADYDVRI